MRSLSLFLMLFLMLCLPQSGKAEGSVGGSAIVATVNEDAITRYDVETRTKLSLLSANASQSQEARAFLEKKALDALIAERLQFQQAAKENITVEDTEVTAAFGQLEQQNNMPAGTLKRTLAKNNIPESVMARQIRASLVWSEVIRRKFGNRVVVSDSEVNSLIGRLEAHRGQTEYFLYEIFFSAEKGNAEVRANHVFEQLRKGGNFPSLARQFSDSITGALGGEKGWVTTSDVEKSLAVLLPQMQVGQLSRPLPTADGFIVLFLRDKRNTDGTATQSNDSNVGGIATLYQTVVPADDKQAGFVRAQELREKITSCSNAEVIAAQEKLNRSGSLGTLALKDLPPSLQQAIAGTATGQTSAPLLNGNTYLLLTVCDKKLDTAVQPTATAQPTATKTARIDPEKIRQRLRIQKLERFAESYLRQVRESALVVIK